MTPIKLPQSNQTLAEDQPEYQPLPIVRFPSKEGYTMHCWEANEEEKAEFAKTGRLYISQMTFNQPLQPILASVYMKDAYPPSCGLPEGFNVGDCVVVANKKHCFWRIVADVADSYVLIGDPNTGDIETFDPVTLSSEESDFRIIYICR